MNINAMPFFKHIFLLLVIDGLLQIYHTTIMQVNILNTSPVEFPVDETRKPIMQGSEGEGFAWLFSLNVILHKEVWRKKSKDKVY